MAADTAADEHGIPFPDGAAAKPRRTQRPDPRRVDVNSVAAAALDHFCVPGDNLHTGGAGGVCRRPHNGFEIIQQEAFFKNQGKTQIPRYAASHAKVVDRTADRKFSDIPAREPPGADDKAVR